MLRAFSLYGFVIHKSTQKFFEFFINSIADLLES